MKDLLDQLAATHESQGRLIAQLNDVLAPIFGGVPRSANRARGPRQEVPADVRAQVLKMMADGKTIAETVQTLGISKSSVSRFRAEGK